MYIFFTLVKGFKLWGLCNAPQLILLGTVRRECRKNF